MMMSEGAQQVFWRRDREKKWFVAGVAGVAGLFSPVGETLSSLAWHAWLGMSWHVLARVASLGQPFLPPLFVSPVFSALHRPAPSSRHQLTKSEGTPNIKAQMQIYSSSSARGTSISISRCLDGIKRDTSAHFLVVDCGKCQQCLNLERHLTDLRDSLPPHAKTSVINTDMATCMLYLIVCSKLKRSNHRHNDYGTLRMHAGAQPSSSC
jgi:hypothetical protein